MNLILTRSGKFSVESSGRSPVDHPKSRFTSMTEARAVAAQAAAALNDLLEALVRVEGAAPFEADRITEAEALAAAARIALSIARNPHITRSDLIDINLQLSDLFKDANRLHDAGQLDMDTLCEIKSTLWTIGDFVDNRDPDSWLDRVDPEYIMNPHRLQD